MKIRSLVVTILFGVLVFWLAFVHYSSVHEATIILNRVSGEVSLGRPGFHMTPPWILVAKIETTPQRVCIPSASKVLICKLARFVPSEYMTLVQREGFRYYWWDNRFSFNFGYHEEYRGARDLIRGYAFGRVKQQFVEVLEELPDEQ